ncbi:hypothetical protein PGB28_17135 [Primorskyibacter aestuariivivens]|uniref:hypothetical protein n=1 Tax=Primorskyibacter aestuariivivens TaxID=1888912 RepID=UPI0023000110|nr:hypothetical protein [Primorskyibacter aestuariivivens]MDA7430190.1 hypothetical protein [Primorskyibacter aestuariivivens]
MAGVFILICSDGYDLNDRRVDGLAIASYRLKSGYWPLYSNTRNRRAIRPGDEFLVYLAGSGQDSRSIVAHGFFGPKKKRSVFSEEDELDIVSGNPETIFGVKDVEFFNPILIRNVLPILHSYKRMKNKLRWGSLLVGGARRISADEMHNILEMKCASD